MATFTTIDRWMQLLQACEDNAKNQAGEIDTGRLCTEIRSVLLQEMQRGDAMLASVQQIERLSREASRDLVDVPAMLGDIARATITKHGGA